MLHYGEDLTDLSQLPVDRKIWPQGLAGEDVEVKRALASALNEFLEPIRERRERYGADMPYVEDVLMDGVRRGRKIAEETMTRVRDAMRISSYTSSWW